MTRPTSTEQRWTCRRCGYEKCRCNDALRGDAVNLARDYLDREPPLTPRGVRMLAEAVLALDESLRSTSAPQSEKPARQDSEEQVTKPAGDVFGSSKEKSSEAPTPRTDAVQNEADNAHYRDGAWRPFSPTEDKGWAFARQLERELAIANLKNAGSLANNLCPDHRDKQAGKSCLACEIERLEKSAQSAKQARGWNDPIVLAINAAIQRGLKHEFFHDGLTGDLLDFSKEEAYVEGWKDAWLEMADDLQHAALDGTNNREER